MATGRVPTTANSPLTAKGDLFGYSTTQARVAVGNDGETLVADSSTSTGLRYQSAYNGNAIINGAFDIWQRGTSIANTATYLYTADRWQSGGSAAQTTTRQASGLTGIQYCARVQRNSGSTSTTVVALGVSLESADSYRFAGQTITFSFWARAGANYSNTGSLMGVYVQSGTGTDQNQNSGFTGATGIINTNATLTTTWQRFTYTGTVASNATQIGVTCYYTPTGTAGANDFFEVTGVQLELGSVATSFKRASGGTIQGELAACQRYYQRLNSSLDSGATLSTSALNYSSTAGLAIFSLPVTMRVYPTAIAFSGTRYVDANIGVYTGVSYTIGGGINNNVRLDFTATGMTTGRPGWITQNGSTSDFIALSAEL